MCPTKVNKFASTLSSGETNRESHPSATLRRSFLFSRVFMGKAALDRLQPQRARMYRKPHWIVEHFTVASWHRHWPSLRVGLRPSTNLLLAVRLYFSFQRQCKVENTKGERCTSLAPHGTSIPYWKSFSDLFGIETPLNWWPCNHAEKGAIFIQLTFSPPSSRSRRFSARPFTNSLREGSFPEGMGQLLSFPSRSSRMRISRGNCGKSQHSGCFAQASFRGSTACDPVIPQP